MAIGAAGIGKSLLLQVLAAQYREQFDVVLLACAQLCTRRALLQAIHFELGLDYRRRDEGELRLSLLDTLLSGDEATRRTCCCWSTKRKRWRCTCWKSCGCSPICRGAACRGCGW